MPKRTQTYPQGHYCKVCGQYKVNEKSKLIKMLIRGFMDNTTLSKILIRIALATSVQQHKGLQISSYLKKPLCLPSHNSRIV